MTGIFQKRGKAAGPLSGSRIDPAHDQSWVIAALLIIDDHFAIHRGSTRFFEIAATDAHNHLALTRPASGNVIGL